MSQSHNPAVAWHDAPNRTSAPTTSASPHASVPDEVLVKAAQAHEGWAREALFRRYGPMVNHLAFRLAPWADEADDLVQDSFTEALRSLHRLREPAAFAGWLHAIVTRTAAKRIRRTRLRRRPGLLRPRPVDLDHVIAPTAPPDVAAWLRQLYAAIQELPTEPRIAIILHRVEGLTIPEIARHMHLSEPTVNRRLRVARDIIDAFARDGSTP